MNMKRYRADRDDCAYHTAARYYRLVQQMISQQSIPKDMCRLVQQTDLSNLRALGPLHWEISDGEKQQWQLTRFLLGAESGGHIGDREGLGLVV